MRPALAGGLIYLSYDMMLHYFRHHDEANGRPRYYDHMAAMFVLTTATSAYYCNHPYQILGGMVFSVLLVSPVTWWFKNQAVIKNLKNPNIFYENSCSADEIERYKQQDMVENLGFVMMTQRGFGYVHLPDPKSS